MHTLIEHYLTHLLIEWLAALIERVRTPWTCASYPRLALVLLMTAPVLALGAGPLAGTGWGTYAAAWVLLAATIPVAPDAWLAVARVTAGAVRAATPGG